MPSKAKRKEIMRAKRGRRKLQVLTPTEVHMLLTYCEREEPTLTPYACLCVWGGLRPEREALNMIDDDITTESVIVPEEFAKDNETRIIEPLSDNFIEWIEFIKGREGSFQQVKFSSASGTRRRNQLEEIGGTIACATATRATTLRSLTMPV